MSNKKREEVKEKKTPAAATSSKKPTASAGTSKIKAAASKKTPAKRAGARKLGAAASAEKEAATKATVTSQGVKEKKPAAEKTAPKKPSAARPAKALAAKATAPEKPTTRKSVSSAPSTASAADQTTAANAKTPEQRSTGRKRAEKALVGTAEPEKKALEQPAAAATQSAPATTEPAPSLVSQPTTQPASKTEEKASIPATPPAETPSEQPATTEPAGIPGPEPSPAPEPEEPPTAPPAEPVEQAEPEPAPPPHEPEPYHHEEPVYCPPPMYVVQITPELAPLAKVGGLADVVTGLTRELEIRGNPVEIILPKYDCMRYDQIRDLHITYQDLWVPWYDSAVRCTVWFGFVRDHKCFFIEPHSQDNFFNRGSIYGFDDDILRFAFFSRAAIEFLWKAGKRPEIIHCHDWQSALVPVFLYEIYQHMGMTHPRVCYTIHNFKHQGVTGNFVLSATGLNRPEYYLHPDRLLDNHTPSAVNLMKGGIVYSNFVTTVSPRHAFEAMHGQGFGLEPTLHTHHTKFGGIVNGVDYDVWNPEIDPFIPFRYNVDYIDEKYKNKQALRSRLLLADNEKPIIAFIGRLDPQKGLELVRHALFHSLNHRGQFILLGSSPDSEINSYFWELKRHLNDSPDCHIEIGFDEELAHLIYCGADMVVVPSQFEPCGLTQLIAMRYGTIPIVRAVGGLADTVFDKDCSDKPLHERNGYVFNDYDEAGLESALTRAIDCYYDFPEHFRELMKNAMRSDYSWNHPGQHYLNICDYIREK